MVVDLKIKQYFPALVACSAMMSSPVQAIDLLAPGLGGFFTHIDSQYNATTWAADNLLDDNVSTRWLSRKRDNDLLLGFDPGLNDRCFGEFTLRNYGNNRSIKQFMLLYTNDAGLLADTGAAGWTPIPADPAPVGPVNHLHWGQGGRLTAVDREYNATTWAGEHINNGSLGDFWLSGRANNTLDFAFDTDWDGSSGDAVNVTELKLHNYGNNRSIRLFQVEVSQDGSIWQKLEVPGTGPGDPDFNYALSHEGGTLDVINREYNATTWAGANIHDGAASSIWLSGRTNNNLDFSFDPDGDGTVGLAGDTDDYFQLQKIALENYGNNRSVKQFQVLVKTAANPNWTAIPVPGSVAGQPDFNFLLSHEGASLTAIDRQYNTTTWAAANIHDGSQQTIWLSNKTNNTLDFAFDPDGSGTPGEATDQFTIEKIALENYGTSRSVENFQIEVKTAVNPNWTKLEVPGSAAGDANFNFLSSHEGAALTFIDRQYNTTTWAAANIYDGSQQSIWLSNRQTNTLEFDFDTNLDGTPGDAVNFSRIRMQNYGTNRSVQTFEVDVQIGGGPWQAVPAPGGGTVFTAAQASAEQEWNVTAQNNVTAFRIRTLTNYGDTYTGIRELEILGSSIGASHTFTAAQSSAEQTFVLDVADQPSNVTEVRFRSISNYGDTYIGVRELKILGDSVTRDHTFVALQSSAEQIFTIEPADRPADVTAIRFQTISNYGDTYIGAREVRFLGDAVTASHTFTAAQPSSPQSFVLDADDKATNVVAARLRTITNYGDTYIGAREFELLGDPVGPLYVFDAAKGANEQSWSFAATTGKLFRLHTFDNHGDTYTGAGEIGLMQAVGCYPAPVGAWNMDEVSWGAVTDSSGNGLDGIAVNGATTDDSDPASPGTPGTCGYGVFDGNNDYVSVPHNPLLDGTSELTYSIWIHPRSWSGGIRQVMAKSVHGGGSGRAQMGIFSENGVLKGRAETLNGREDIQTTLPSTNSWSHVALVFDGNTLKLYVNGVVASDGSFATTELATNPDPLEIGRRTLSNRYFFNGYMDEARVFDQALTDAEIAYVMNQKRPCTQASPPDEPAFAFNCVEPGQDILNGHLYTKVVGQSFNVDVIALQDADSDNAADGVEPDFAQAADRTVTLELVDTSVDSCATSGQVIASQNLVFTAANAGYIPAASIPAMTINTAYRSVNCRVTDATDAPTVVTGCSTDNFAVRPGSLSLNIPVMAFTDENNDPKLAAGEDFTLEVTTVAGYDGTPEIAIPAGQSTRIEPHSGGAAGVLTGSFLQADAVTGTAEGTFNYSEVGNFRFWAEALRDTAYTSVDQNADCIDGSYSNTPDASGRVGCDFSNTTATARVGRFTPHHFSVSVDETGVLNNTCAAGGFSYAGTDIPFSVDPSITITALNKNDSPTVNYQGDYDKLTVAGISMPGITSDGTQAVALTWNTGSQSLVNNNDGTLTFTLTGDTFTYGHDSTDMVAPFQPDIDLEIDEVKDIDDIIATSLPGPFSPDATTNDVWSRYGRLAVLNAYGSELQTLPMTMRVEYYNGSGSGFIPNTDDSCTVINDVVITDADTGDSLAVNETCIWDPAGNSGSYSCASAGDPADQYSPTPAASDFNLNLMGPGTGNTGVLNVTVNSPDHLDFDWLGGGMSNPTGTASFGIHNTNSRMIFLKEVR